MPLCAAAQDVAPEPAPELHWSQKIGLKVMQIDQTIPTVDCVVLVPDAATYLDELARWSPLGRWPVLIEDSRFAPMFLRRFGTLNVYRRESVGPLPDAEQLRERVERAVINAIGGTEEQTSILGIFKQRNWIPPGLVITSLNDPAWTGAVALAAGHGQPLAFIDGNYGTADSAPLTTELDPLADAVTNAVANLGYQYDRLGDEIDVLTVCRQMAGRLRLQQPGGTDQNTQYFAITDALGRTTEGARYACVGWIFGSEIRSAYVAMCSLFLPREKVALVNTYPQKEQPWVTYGTAGVAALLGELGYAPMHSSGNAATQSAWLRSISAGMTADLAIINTRGNVDWFQMFDGQRCYATDVPVLNTPAAVHFIHSWSMQRPQDASTIAGRWLDRGAYAYVGSVHEPGLTAFVPPSVLAQRTAGGVPFLIAARHWEQPIWKVNTFGDPLMTAAQPVKPPRIAPPDPFDRGVDLRNQLKDMMLAASKDESGRTYQQAIETLSLLGMDEIAGAVWRHAVRTPAALYSSRAALGPLFRQGEVNDFLDAWQLLPSRDDLASDMIWHMFGPRLGSAHADALLQLQSAVRKPLANVDVERLMPYIRSKFGASQAAQMLQREIDTAANDTVRRRLEALRAK